MNEHATFKIVKQDEDSILIFDIGPWSKYPTITNDADWVVQELYNYHYLYNDKVKRLFYIDSEGDKSELLHKNGVFTGFN